MEKNENGYSEYRFGNNGADMREGCGDTERQNGQSGGCGCQMNGGCSCTELKGRQLAMVYSPSQAWQMLYTPSEALKHGTLFEELYKPVGECKNG